MSVEEIRSMVRRFVDEPWNKGNVAVIDELCSPDYTLRYDSERIPGGREDLKQAILKYRANSPDFHAQVDEIIVEGDQVAYHWTMCGTDEQGKSKTIVGITWLRIVAGKIVQDRFLSAEVKSEQAGE